MRLHSLLSRPDYTDSPAALIHEGAPCVRARLAGPSADLSRAVFREVSAAGGTDYYAVALEYGDGYRTFMSWATDAEGGFADEHIRTFDRLAPLLGLRLELDGARYTMRSLLSVYLGNNAAQRVLAGHFCRGHGEIIRCAIFFSDMRGFTVLADHAPPAHVVRTLDAYFERVAGPISAHGGEVLKFIGDAVMAIFPTGNDEHGACQRAASAAREALAGIAEMNAHREHPPVSAGIALHLGEVMYGNVGSRDRLDFTVIGAAVNEASRVEGMCKVTEMPVLMTRAFATAYGGDVVSVGRHQLKGVSEEHELFTLQELWRPKGPEGSRERSAD
jgi:adenylate cyclase